MPAGRLPAVALALCFGVLAIHLLPGGDIVAGALAVIAFAGRQKALALALAIGAIAAAVQLEQLGSARDRGRRAGAGDRADDIITGDVIAVERARGWVRAVVRADAPLEADVMVTVQGAIKAPLPGDRARIRGRLFSPRGYRVDGAPDPVRALASRGAALSMSARPDAAQWIPGDGRPLRRAAERAHRGISDWVEARGGGWSGNAVMRAMLTGDRRDLDGPINDAFQGAGLGHVLSVSGLHLAVIAMFMFGLVRRLWLLVPPLADRIDASRAAALAAIPVTFAYTLITGLRAPTLRAGIAVAIVLVGVLLRRRARAIDAISLAACAILADNPCSLFDPSFQLSFAAAATLALVAGRTRPGRLRWLRGAVAATLWATAATAPIAALHFSTVSLASVATNLAVVPAIELVGLPLGFVGIAIAPVWESAGGALVDLSIGIAAWIAWLAHWVAQHVPMTGLAPPDAVELLALGAAWAGAIAWARRRRGLRIALAGIALAFAWRLWMTEIAPRWRDELRVTFVDVGQGDAAVIEFPGGGVWLIDAGGLPFPPPGASAEDAARAVAAPGERALLPFLRHRRIGRIEVAVLSHVHPDHYAGMAALVGQVEIGQLWLARPSPDAAWPPPFASLLDRLRAHGTRIVHPRLGAIRRGGGVEVALLSPRGDGAHAAADAVLSENDNSMTVRIERAGTAILLPGDLEEEGEQELLASGGPEIAADVIKVPHHGSATSSTPRFVRAVSARFAVISCGFANRFGFPDPEVVARWRDAGARVWRTDLEGSITITVGARGGIALLRHGE